MKNFNLNYKNTIMILFVIVMFFFLYVGKSFDKLKNVSPNNNITTSVAEQNDINDSNSRENDEDISVEEEINDYKHKNLYVNLQSDIDVLPETNDEEITIPQPTEKMELIDTETYTKEKINSNNSELSLEEQICLKFYEAKNKIKNKEYNEAISEYKNIFEIANNNTTKANCYEGIAEVYAIQKRYGSALSFAQRAYNTSPTSKKELLIARLYYKTGNIKEANNRIHNILQRDFADEKN